ncbi:alpha/beta fold hydrolase [Acinetobacter gerneri]|uniref:alpha/beta fold hydrolase n=1 Tax=Acinetobacter gerneri TaxID=202952 RepID=UPI0028AA7041|nr:alpha/beta fold hydrolase [Acinetobacter gerneri]
MFTFQLSSDDLFKERSQQFISWGIPHSVIRDVQTKINNTWSEEEGGWAYEWSKKANDFENKGKFLEASMMYAAAHFPVISTSLREKALAKQIKNFEKAMKIKSIDFKRMNISLDSTGTKMPVHLYNDDTNNKNPLILLTGGVDTGKMELHRMAYLIAKLGDFRVAAIDMPGTGESGVNLTPSSENIYIELLNTLAPTGRKAIVGVSYGGHWAAKLALLGKVDASVNLGGPVIAFDKGGDFIRTLPNGMGGIIANALGLNETPETDVFQSYTSKFSLESQGFFDKNQCSPMLVINGENDQYIPQQDSIIFKKYSDNDVWLMKGMTHCAAEGIARILPSIITWLQQHLYGLNFKTNLKFKITEAILPTRIL